MSSRSRGWAPFPVGVLGLWKIWAPGCRLQRGWGRRGSCRLGPVVPHGTLGFENLLSWGVLARGVAPVIVLWMGVRCQGIGGGPLSLLVYLYWGRGGLRCFCLGVFSKYASPHMSPAGDALGRCGSPVFVL